MTMLFFSILETSQYVLSLMGSFEVYMQPSSSSSSPSATSTISLYVYLLLFLLSGEKHVENIEKETNRFYWLFHNPSLVSFIFTPLPFELLCGLPSSLAAIRVRWLLLPLLQVLLKFYGLAWLGQRRFECICEYVCKCVGVCFGENRKDNNNNNVQNSSNGGFVMVNANRIDNSNPNKIKERYQIIFFLVVHMVLWVCLVGGSRLLQPLLVSKVILTTLFLLSSDRKVSQLRIFTPNLSRNLLLSLFFAIDFMAMYIFSYAAKLFQISNWARLSNIDSDTTLVMLVQCVGYLPMNFLIYFLLHRPKQLTVKEFIKIWLQCHGIAKLKTIKMKKLFYYIATNQNIIEKELLAGVVANMFSTPFSSGAMRDAYYVFLQPSNTLYQIEELNTLFHRQTEASNDLVIGKFYKPHIQAMKNVNIKEQMLNDLYMHMKAQEYSRLYNKHNPPKTVDFVQAVIFECEDGQFMWVEEKINGDYDKYSNNAGWVNNTRLSPHSFSHFTYHHSNHKLVVVDMQGAEKYTDPQIHSNITLLNSVWQFFGLEKKEEFGCGNLGKQGIELWKKSHDCSDLCKVLELPELKRSISSGEKSSSPPLKSDKYVGSTIVSLKKYRMQKN